LKRYAPNTSFLGNFEELLTVGPHAGYWCPQVGFYGGINYGSGYFGSGFIGGHWEGNVFHHNTAVSNVDRPNVQHVYEDGA
jgi:hypothetical protein